MEICHFPCSTEALAKLPKEGTPHITDEGEVDQEAQERFKLVQGIRENKPHTAVGGKRSKMEQ